MKKKYNYNTIYVRKTLPFITQKDKRFEKYSKFKERHGFSPDECWNLDETIMQFALPRLRYFRNHTMGYPSEIKSFEKWQEILDKMIFSFENVPKYGFYLTDKNEKKLGMTTEQYRKKAHEGLRLFGKYFLGLWW